MGGKAWLAVALLVAPLAGCFGDDAPENVGTTDTDVETDTVADVNETQAPEGRGDISAFKETNRTETGAGGMMHAHDYWNGEERKVVLQADMWFIPLPLVPCRTGSFPGGECYPPGTSIADIDIPAPNLVFEGTDKVEVLFDNLRAAPTCLAAMRDALGECPIPNGESPLVNPVAKMNFDYLTAADEPGAWREGPEVTPGTPVVLDISPTDADMPHAVKSLWLFRIYTDEPTSVLFNFTVTVVRGDAIVDWPPHPDLYADKTERVVLDGEFTTETKGWAEYWINGNDANWIYPERVISYGTDTLEITVERLAFTVNGAAPAIEPDFFYLDYHNASFLSKLGNGDLSGGRLVDEANDGTTWRFAIPVDDAGMDSPYGEASRWAFRFMARYSEDACPDVDQSIQQGCQWFPYQLRYKMTILAKGHSTADESGVDPNAATPR